MRITGHAQNRPAGRCFRRPGWAAIISTLPVFGLGCAAIRTAGGAGQLALGKSGRGQRTRQSRNYSQTLRFVTVLNLRADMRHYFDATGNHSDGQAASGAFARRRMRIRLKSRVYNRQVQLG